MTNSKELPCHSAPVCNARVTHHEIHRTASLELPEAPIKEYHMFLHMKATFH
jgi:hypothetical protein